jgi:peptidoglycan/LPS O-acetylase OafA/YrhL
MYFNYKVEAIVKHLYGLDWLRAIMSVFVLAWHLSLFGTSSLFKPGGYLKHEFQLSDFINFNLLLYAVPTFIFISAYLFASKPRNLDYLIQKLKEVLTMFLVWVIAIHIFRGGFSYLVAAIPRNPSEWFMFFITAGNTAYYFFICLAVVLALVYYATRLNLKWTWIGFITGVLLLLALPLLSIKTGIWELSAYWNPMNYLAYPFAAVLLHHYREHLQGFKLLSLILVGLTIVTVILEWKCYIHQIFVAGQGYAFPAYTRVSLLLGCILMMLLFLNVSQKPPRWLMFMSEHSMGLYVLHPMVKGVLIVLVKQSNPQISWQMLSLVFILTLLISYAGSYVLKQLVLKPNVLR